MQRDLGDNVATAALGQATNVASSARSNVLTGNQIWTGHLASNIYVRRSRDGPGEHRIRIIASPHYAPYVEYGTGSRGRITDPYPDHKQFNAPGLMDGQPPPGLLRNIHRWVMTKPGFIGPFGGISRDQVAYLIARTIARIGTNAHPYMRPAWFANEVQLRQAVRMEVKRTVR